MKEHYRETLAEALKTYGPTPQTFMVMEEMAELQKELCKNVRGKQNRENIAEEIADVEIMLEQMKLLYGISTAVEDYWQIKMTRLRQRLKEVCCTDGADG